MLRAVDPAWELREERPADGGYLPVHHLVVDTPAGTRRVVLKAAPDGDGHGVDLEARLLRILGEHTAIPVPTVLGAVDESGVDDLPTPFVCMAQVPGRTVERSAVGDLSGATVEGLARASGRYLAELHSLDVVDGFGFLAAPDSPTLRGGRPPTTPDQIVVGDPASFWRTRLEEWAEETLDRAAETRFGDLVPDLRPVLEREIDAIEGPFEPVLARVDNSIENLRYDPATGTVEGVLDWAFTIAATPAYDLVHVELSLAGGLWRFVPSAPDHAATVRPALLDGYEEGASTAAAVRRLAANRSCYELLSLCRATHLFDDWPGLRGASAEQESAAAQEIRTALETYC